MGELTRFIFLSFFFFLNVDHFLSFYWICYNISYVLCLVFWLWGIDSTQPRAMEGKVLATGLPGKFPTYEFLSLILVNILSPAAIQLPFKCSSQATTEASTLGKLWLSVSPASGWWFDLWSQYSDESKKSCWFSFCSAIFLVRPEVRTPKVLQVRL